MTTADLRPTALQIEPAGWRPVSDPERRRWEDEAGDQLTIDFFPIPPDVPPYEGTNLEAFCRWVGRGVLVGRSTSATVDRDAIAMQLMRYRDENARRWADVIDVFTGV